MFDSGSLLQLHTMLLVAYLSEPECSSIQKDINSMYIYYWPAYT